MTVGFIGQGYVGRACADVMEARGIDVVRYALEEPWRRNRNSIKNADIVFIAVPTPTSPEGHDTSIVAEALGLIAEAQTAVIKSTVLPGTTRRLQEQFPHLTVLCSPEFLSAATARQDAEAPALNIVGMSADSFAQRQAASRVHTLLPKAQFAHTCSSDEAEIIKYAHNLNGYMAILGLNLMYDLSQRFGCDWKRGIEPALLADPCVPDVYARPIHKGGRGAGGACFIKDVAAVSDLYAEVVGDGPGINLLNALQLKNLALLKATAKDMAEVAAVYHGQVKKDAA